MCSTTLKNDFVDKLRRRNFEGEGTEVRKTAYQEYLPWESFFMQMAQLCEKRPGLDKDRSQIVSYYQLHTSADVPPTHSKEHV